MGKKQFIDRKNARHFHLVHRSQRDPLSRDESAPQRVLKEVIPANLIGKIPQPQEEFDGEYSDGEADIFGAPGEPDGINYGTYDREIEDVELVEAPTAKGKKKKVADETKIGEAALLGLVDEEFNDGSYDYTQHFKEIGRSSEGVFMAAPKVLAQQKKAAAQQTRGIMFTDEDAAQEMAREEMSGKGPAKKGLRLPSGVLPSREELDFADVYQGNAPMGLNPDMPYDIRETLEALEDEEFVDDELDESFFDQLDADGDFDDEEVEEYYEDEDENGEGAGGWEADFKKFKKQQEYLSDDSYEGSDDGHSQYSKSSRRVGGASASTFSMSSSAMFRNENLTLLDERFDKVEREYESDSDEDEEGTDLVGEELRKDFDSILDDFLDKFEIVGSKMVPRLEGATSENKLTTIRNAMLVDDEDEEKSIATTVGGTKHRKKKDEEVPEEIQTDFRSRAERMRDNWDVQTILSTYSNLDNHPGMIKEQNRKRIHIDPKTGMPVVTEKLSKKALQRRKEEEEAAAAAEAGSDEEDEEEFDDEEEPENLGAKRNKAETKEEKKARKEAIKAEKKNRRETKKATKTAFASEKVRQEKVMKNLKKDHGVLHLD
ncbi:hypothetical protein BG004_007131 [Podila humilis]|nr:hypothetical protein BG004_007131 [Podila humilis]